LSFTPSEAIVRDDVPQSWMIIEPEQPRVAVSLDALNQLPPTVPASTMNKPVVEVTPIQASPASEQTSVQQELQATKDVVVKQAQELQQLKAELESLRRQLAEKESAASKAKPKTSPRKPAPTP
jgi:septal ring factor EnvC (AmiA/AmiB activator)